LAVRKHSGRGNLRQRASNEAANFSLRQPTRLWLHRTRLNSEFRSDRGMLGSVAYFAC
jgi:hypothetical protein